MTAIVKLERANLYEKDFVLDLVFIREGLNDDIGSMKPWKTLQKTDHWPKDWLLDEFDFPCRVFDAAYYLNSECWQDRFPLLECSKIVLHQLRKHKVGDANHFTVFFAWSLDGLFLKQIIHTALLDELEVSPISFLFYFTLLFHHK